LENFTKYLRLRFLLQPLSYARDVETLRARSAGETWRFEELRAFVQQAPMQDAVGCVAPAAALPRTQRRCVLPRAVASCSVVSSNRCKRQP
jgi:hypothetical protein